MNASIHAALNKAILASGMSLSALARRADLPLTTVNRLAHGHGTRVDTLEAVLRPLGLRLEVVPDKTPSAQHM